MKAEELKALFKDLGSKKVSFGEKINFKEEKKKGSFAGVLVNYENKKLAHGIYRFKKGSMKVNNGKKLFILYQHDGYQVPVGTMSGESTDKGFVISAELDLTLLENGNPINQAAHSLYSLMKNQKAEFELSVGGNITKKEYIEDDKERYISINEFDAYEGSIVMRGAVEGSKITKIFSEDPIINEKQEGTKMTAEQMEALFAKLEKKLFSANTEKEIVALKESFTGFKADFKKLPTELKADFDAKFTEINEVLKTLKSDYADKNVAEFTEIQEIYAMFQQIKGNNRAIELGEGEELVLEADTKKTLKFSATTVAVPDAIKPTYTMKILERLQSANPVLADVSFLSITDNSLKISREELGLPTTGIVGETDTRTETTTVTLDNVAIELFQWYVLPVVSNKLLATNYLGYLPFLIKRAEYAMALNLANKIFNGTGSGQPTGILVDANITQTVDFKLDTGGVDLDDGVFAKKIKTIYYTPRSEVAEKAKWYMRRGTWEYISNLQNSINSFYMQDLSRAGERTLMGRPVVLVESDDSGLKDIGTTNGDDIIVFGDLQEGIRGIVNNKMTISLKDQLTTKGFTKFYIEKGMGFGVQLPENFVKVTNTTD